MEPGFSRRTCEGVLEELVRRCSSYALAAMDKGLPAAAAAMGVTAQGGADPEDVVLTRMAQDERDVQVGAGGTLVSLNVGAVTKVVCCIPTRVVPEVREALGSYRGVAAWPQCQWQPRIHPEARRSCFPFASPST